MADNLIEQDEDKLSKSYKRYDADSTTLEDALEAFRKIVPHIETRYPSINFDSLSEKDAYYAGLAGEGEYDYRLCGSYRQRCFLGIPLNRYVTLLWKTYPYCDEHLKEFMPVIRFGGPLGTGYFFETFNELDSILERHIKNPILD